MYDDIISETEDEDTRTIRIPYRDPWHIISDDGKAYVELVFKKDKDGKYVPKN